MTNIEISNWCRRTKFLVNISGVTVAQLPLPQTHPNKEMARRSGEQTFAERLLFSADESDNEAKETRKTNQLRSRKAHPYQQEYTDTSSTDHSMI